MARFISELTQGGLPAGAGTLVWAETSGGLARKLDIFELHPFGGTWNFDTDTTATDPGSGDIKFNNATLASVTSIYISQTSAGGQDATTLLGFVASGQSIYVGQGSDETKSAVFSASGSLTDNGAWWTIPVTVTTSNTLMDSAALCGVMFGVI